MFNPDKITTIPSNTKVPEDEVVTMFTATCNCGRTMYRANKEATLNNTLKYTSKCCKSNYALTGQKNFKGDVLMDENTMLEDITEEVVEEVAEEVIEKVTEEVIEEVAIVEPEVIDEVETEEENVEQLENIEDAATDSEVTDTEVVEPTTEVQKSELVTPGKRGVSNTQLIPVLKTTIKNGNDALLEELYNTYHDAFISSIKYMNDQMKLKMYAVISKYEGTKPEDLRLGKRALENFAKQGS